MKVILICFNLLYSPVAKYKKYLSLLNLNITNKNYFLYDKKVNLNQKIKISDMLKISSPLTKINIILNKKENFNSSEINQIVSKNNLIKSKLLKLSKVSNLKVNVNKKNNNNINNDSLKEEKTKLFKILFLNFLNFCSCKIKNVNDTKILQHYLKEEKEIKSMFEVSSLFNEIKNISNLQKNLILYNEETKKENLTNKNNLYISKNNN